MILAKRPRSDDSWPLAAPGHLLRTLAARRGAAVSKGYNEDCCLEMSVYDLAPSSDEVAGFATNSIQPWEGEPPVATKNEKGPL